MSALNDLVAQIEDASLRDRIAKEVERLAKQKKFGLVFEEHLPECSPLYDIPIKVGAQVAKKTGKVNDIYRVLSIKEGVASCLHRDSRETVSIAAEELVVVAEFGEPIFPYLKPLDSVCNAPDNALWHTLIEADNYHALQLLEYLYAGKVDCIYIDPPYNTGAKDWKYNNDYVDGNDSYRHSKWLSFIQKRLKIAKKLLNPKDSVLIVTIDEKEYLHLGCLLEESFPEAKIQMVSITNNQAGAQRLTEFTRVDEFAFFVMFGAAAPQRMKLGSEWIKEGGRTHLGEIRWDLLRRTGTNAQRRNSPGCFYPIYISEDCKKFIGVGETLDIEKSLSEAPASPEGVVSLWPVRQDGSEGRWQLSQESFQQKLAKGLVKLGPPKGDKTTVYYLKPAEEDKLNDGTYSIVGHNEDGSVITSLSNAVERKSLPTTQWQISSHDSTHYGTRLIKKFIPGREFSYPKSLYAVRDTIMFFVTHKKQALIVDFFAGSGTTLHAVNLLNSEDGGSRRCVMVTNNEVSEEEAKVLKAKGFHPGSLEWENLGIARYITWPRTVASITGLDVNGCPIKGEYLGSQKPFSSGFSANAVFCKLGFLDKTSIALGQQFREMLPMLWMKAGAQGKCPEITTDEIPSLLVLPENNFAVLVDERYYMEFVEELDKNPEIETIFIVTDSDAGYRDMIVGMEAKNTYQLYRDYLDNFRINSARR